MDSSLENALLHFDGGQYFEAQELFLDIPADATETDKRFHKALGQINMGFCLYENDEHVKALAMIMTGYSKLRDIKDAHAAFSANKLMHDLEKIVRDLESGRPMHIKPKIHFT